MKAQITVAGFDVGGLLGPWPAWGVKEMGQWIKVPFTSQWAQQAHMPPTAMIRACSPVIPQAH